MGVYSGAEVFQIAMELEETGRVFYETAAEATNNRAVADICKKLAEEEGKHHQRLKTMGEELVRRPPSRPLTWDELHFAQLLIEERVLPDPEAAVEAASGGKAQDILDIALRLEKDSLLLYYELLGEVDSKDSPAVQQIIKEEQTHVRNLTEAKRNLSSSG